MQPDPEQQLSLLPRRNSQYRSKFHCDEASFYTNLYELEFQNRKNQIYQFVLDATPEVKKDSPVIYKKIYRAARKDIQAKIGEFMDSNAMIWGFKSIKQPIVLQVEFELNGEQHKYDLVIKQTKELNFEEFIKDKKTQQSIIQMINVKIKSTLRNHLQMYELGRGRYYNQKIFKIGNLDLDARKGFKFSVLPIQKRLVVQVDVCTRITRSYSFLEDIHGKSPQEANNKYVGVTIITREGKIRTFRIEEIDYSMSPKSEFFRDDKEGKVSFLEYFKKKYGIKIGDLKQPMIKVIGHYNRKLVNGELEEEPVYIYLVPELVSLTGMSDDDRKNFGAMKEVAVHTKLDPNQRAEANQNVIKNFNSDGTNEFIKIGRASEVKGFRLNEQQIVMGKGSCQTNGGQFKTKNAVLFPASFTDWVFVYSRGNKPDFDDRNADQAYDIMKSASKAYGIKVNGPGFIAVDNGKKLENWTKAIQKDFNENGAPQIVVIFVSQHQEALYGKLKKFLTVDLKVPSQFIRKRTLGDQKKGMSAASKILLQMNAKIGLPIWEVAGCNKLFNTNNKTGGIMYGGISISKGKNGYSLAFVGTINKELTKVFSYAKVGFKNKENLPTETFEVMFKKWVQSYFQHNNGTAPSTVIIYREGLAEAQIEKFCRKQISSLKKMITKIGEKAGAKNYTPNVLFIGVNKKISQRFYNKQSSNGGKFIPRLSNPDSGSVIVENLSVGGLTDFHLAAQRVTQGTCTPTQYIVIYQNEQFKLDIEDLAEFTFAQCFNYYNWQGAVRVPSCLQCADKLAKLVGESINHDLIDIGDVGKKHFFL